MMTSAQQESRDRVKEATDLYVEYMRGEYWKREPGLSFLAQAVVTAHPPWYKRLWTWLWSA